MLQSVVIECCREKGISTFPSGKQSADKHVGGYSFILGCFFFFSSKSISAVFCRTDLWHQYEAGGYKMVSFEKIIWTLESEQSILSIYTKDTTTELSFLYRCFKEQVQKKEDCKNGLTLSDLNRLCLATCTPYLIMEDLAGHLLLSSSCCR
jgi:hypothetical protein